MQLIAVDIGNSSTKIACAETSDVEITWSQQIEIPAGDEFDLRLGSIQSLESAAFWTISSVNVPRHQSLEKWVQTNRPQDRFHVIAESDVPLVSDIESREQLGRDRLLAAFAAAEQNERNGPIIVVDAGTAVTIDLVDKNLVFQGGYIFPGSESNFRQLVQHTAALPGLDREGRDHRLPNLKIGAVGKSTSSAIFNGVYQAQIQAIRGMVEAVANVNGNANVYFTGGGAEEIKGHFPENWNHVPDLVLRGAVLVGRRLESHQQSLQ